MRIFDEIFYKKRETKTYPLGLGAGSDDVTHENA